ncbi:MAG: efflux RND transporter periplasmic adaptor subunit [Acidobacteriia bacterium]|nr:efflux RND transporter periplasmic adaptor subunit [Terriglobia bacterium]
MKKWIPILVVVIAAAVLVTVIRYRGGPKPTEPVETVNPNVAELSLESQRNAGLVVEEIRSVPIANALQTTGIVSADQARIAHVLPLARGVVEKLYVRLGDRVTPGQPLVLYDNIELGELVGDYLTLRSGLGKLKAQERTAEQSFVRAKTLIEVRAISQREFELREAEWEEAKAAVTGQMAALSQVEMKVRRMGMGTQELESMTASSGMRPTASASTIRAPFGGVITQCSASIGTVVDRDREILTLADISSVWILADVYEKDLGLVRTGSRCQVRVSSYPNEVFPGSLTNVSDSIDPASRTAKARCVVANPNGRLKLEMFASVEIPTEQARAAVAIPIEALQEINGEAVAFVQRNETTFEKRPLRLGTRTSQWVEILQGVKAGEKVVSKGSFYLKSTILRGQISSE